jgi:hypothetical protein
VAGFYRQLMKMLNELGADVRIWPVPVELEERIPSYVLFPLRAGLLGAGLLCSGVAGSGCLDLFPMPRGPLANQPQRFD